ncbi:putative uncharacterized protein DDB_G0282133 isoform X1 [Drosophila pseudoobscura]|uniref:Uncharacterized protein n=1 Tax=Drosophila pseudoobscura pseudoobscura TaxID=46245 RepID=A0A6I8VF95_DROPS|nr:putative uncharacterized protein DDB_G0282133 isoform X1 [Drosophila pseudoobscura]XP_015040029.2 putative uncharacterized protein DDB_G0282133 isoform X1 [Drosophila pseudoobscura]
MTKFNANAVLWSLDDFMKIRKDEMPIYYKKEYQMSKRFNRISAHLQSYKDAEADLSQDEDDDGDCNIPTVQKSIDVDDATYEANINQLNFEKNDFDQLMYNDSLETNDVNSSTEQCEPLSQTPPRQSVKSRLGVRTTESVGNRGKQFKKKAIQKRGKAYPYNINGRNNSMENYNQNRVSANFHRGLEAYYKFRERNECFGESQNVLNIPNSHVHIENFGPNGPSFNDSSNTDNFNLNSNFMMRSNHMNTSDSNSFGGLLPNNQGPVNSNNRVGMFSNNQESANSNRIECMLQNNQEHVNLNSYGGLFLNNQRSVNSNSFGGLFPSNQGPVNSNSRVGMFPNNQRFANSNRIECLLLNNQEHVNSNGYDGLLSNNPVPVNSNGGGLLSNNPGPVNSKGYGGLFSNNPGPVNSNGHGGLLSNNQVAVNSNGHCGLLSNNQVAVNLNGHGGLLSNNIIGIGDGIGLNHPNTSRRDIIANNWNSSIEMNSTKRIPPNNFLLLNRQELLVDGSSSLSVGPARPTRGMFIGEALGMTLSDCKTVDVHEVAKNVLHLLSNAEKDSESKTNYGVHNKNTSQQREL